MTHSFPTHLLFSNFHAATVADDSAISDSLILAAIALVILGRTENLLAEKTISLRLVSPVVNRLRLEDFTM